MDIKAQSIDWAAWGYLRHRFLRAGAGSVLVLLVLAGWTAAIIGAGFGAMQLFDKELGTLAVEAALAAAVVGLCLGAWLFLRPRAMAFARGFGTDFLARNWRSVAIRSGVILALLAAVALGLRYGIPALLTMGALLGTVGLFAAGITLGFVVAVAAVALLLALVQALPRRLTSLPVLGGFAAVLGFGLYLTIGPLLPGIAVSSNLPPSAVLLGLATAIIGFEIVLQAWWQFWASDRAFFSGRGWRPAPMHLRASMQRHLGLPGFLASFRTGKWRLIGLYSLEALCNAVFIAAIAAPIGLIAAPNLISWWLVLAIPVAVAVAVGAYWLGRRLARAAQAAVTTHYQSVREWDTRPPVLFLRAFDQDSAKIAARTLDPMVKWLAGAARPQTLDEILLEHATPYGPVIAIGDPRSKTPVLGAARIFVDGGGTEWQDVVRGLAQAAKVVIVCPTSTEGVRWELDLVNRHELYARTIFLANPELNDSDTLAQFEAMAPGMTLKFKKKRKPIAAFYDRKKGDWVLLAAKKRTLQTYTVALNCALQGVLGRAGVPAPKRVMERPPKLSKAEKKAAKAAAKEVRKQTRKAKAAKPGRAVAPATA